MSMAIFFSDHRTFRPMEWLARLRPRASRPKLVDLAAKPDDRLLRDIGLTRGEALGVDGVYRREIEKARRLWSL